MKLILAPYLAAGSLAWLAYFLMRNVRLEGTAARQLRHFQNHSGPSQKELFGERLVGLLPLSRETWQQHLTWAQRGGLSPGQTLGGLTLTAWLYALAGVGVVLLHPVPILFIVPALAGLYPFLALRSQARRVRRRVVRALPEIAVLVAAEVSAGTPPEQALTRAGELPGPLSGLIAEAVSQARQTGRPLFSRPPVRGALVETFQKSGLPPLRAFASQLDLIAGQGVDSAALMTDLARGLAREYRAQVLTEKEQLGGKLTTRVAIFFFFPAVTILMMAFLIPMLQMFR